MFLTVDPKHRTASLRQRCGFTSLEKVYYFVIPFTIDAEAWGSIAGKIVLMNCHLSEVDTEISSKNQENSFGMQGPKNKLNAMMHRSGRCLQMGACF